MNAPLRKGWCPGALRPMEAKDGLLVRLRITGGILPAATAHALADLATLHGNGLFDLSARGNLQMRGVRMQTLPALQDGLQGLGLLDATTEAESVRNVIASPLAGLHGGLDIRPLTAALEARLVADATLHALPGKFGFLIDDGSQPSLADVDADVRFDWLGDVFATGIAGSRATAARIGFCGQDDLVKEATGLANKFLDIGRTGEARRMRDVADEIVGSQALSAEPYREAWDSPAPVRHLALVAPYGRLDAAMLRSAATLAERTTHMELRLTPFRTLLIPGAVKDQDIPGFITDPDDPRSSVAACVGQTGCARGTTDTHADATALAAMLSATDAIALHVSGCEKGCAKPSATPLTLVARGGRYDVVRNGRAGDPPIQSGLDLAACRDLLRRSA